MGHHLRFPFLGVSSSIARIAIFIGSNYGKKAETCSVGLWLEYQRNEVSFCSVDNVVGVEKVALHPRGCSAVFGGAGMAFVVFPPAGRRLYSWPAKVPATTGDRMPVVLLAWIALVYYPQQK